MKKQILVHDDEKGLVNRYVQRLRDIKFLREDFDVDALYVQDFRDEMGKLADRRRNLRKRKKTEVGDSRLDRADIFIVDFDLLKSDPEGVWNSENVAYLVRCFSSCGFIIGLNLPTCREFDLSLRGNLDSYADLNIVNKQLDNVRLWNGKLADSFRPWYWPSLCVYIESIDQRLRDVKQNLNAPMLRVLELANVIEMLPKTVTEFIGGKAALDATFRDFVQSSPNALHRRDKNDDSAAICRIAAARISKWLERRVLPGQNIVVDAPHLVARYPSLLKDRSSLESWNQSAKFLNYKGLNIDYKRIDKFRYSKSHWFSRPVWFWRKLAEFAGIKEVAKPLEREPAEFRFCEDASRFYHKKVCEEFIADVDSPYNRRFVRRFKNVDYQPRVRLFV